MDETPLVLAASPPPRRWRRHQRDRLVVIWLGLAGALLLVAYFAPFAAVAPDLNNRRGQFALIGTNMVVAAAVGYFVVVVTS